MLSIRQKQIEEIQASRDEEFAISTVQFYRDNYPIIVKKMNNDDLMRYIKNAMKAARDMGIAEGDGVTLFVSLAVVAGPNFVFDPTIRSYIEYPGATPTSRLYHLLQRVLIKFETLRLKA